MKHFLDVADYSPAEIQDILDLAIRLKKEHFSTGNKPLFKGKVLGMIFQKPSLRTRVSFDMAMRHMGGDALYLSPNEIGLGKRIRVVPFREPTRDRAAAAAASADDAVPHFLRVVGHHDEALLAAFFEVLINFLARGQFGLAALGEHRGGRTDHKAGCERGNSVLALADTQPLGTHPARARNKR